MLALLAEIEQVRHTLALRHQPVGNERAVTVGGIALRTSRPFLVLPLPQHTSERLARGVN
jgi:hypothetical protein